MNVGIDAFSFYTPKYFLPLQTLALARQVDPQKYLRGLGQYRMAVLPPDEDVVTMGANAAVNLLNKHSLDDVDLLLFATESAIDQSKAGGLFIHGLLKLSERCRVVELKQACYSGVFGLQLAVSFIKSKMAKKVLLIASDNARYGLATAGESSQGAAAVALLITENPRITALEEQAAFCSFDTMDFFKPNYMSEAIVDGHYSCTVYLNFLKKTWQIYQDETGLGLNDFSAFCFHIPVPRLVEKAYQQLDEHSALLHQEALLYYSRHIGNSYTASFFLGLASLLEQSSCDFTGQRLGCYSYGSGSSSEFFSMIVQPNYKKHLNTDYHMHLLENRIELDIKRYEEFYDFNLLDHVNGCSIPCTVHSGYYRLVKISNHQRIYALHTQQKDLERQVVDEKFYIF
jgi:hydroxymethylglutaryl-CoA synthase